MTTAPATASAATPPAAPSAAPSAGWAAALGRLYAVPPGFRDDSMTRAEALHLLRCGDAELDALVAAGLPCAGPPGEERFDQYDLFNLALDSGSGRSVPELGMEFSWRWMGAGPEDWYRELAWTFALDLECARTGGCGPDPWWSVARPDPERFGGAVDSLAVEPGGDAAGPVVVSAAAGRLGVRATVRTRGRPGELRSPVLRSIVDDFVAAGRRWVRLPEPLQQCYDEVLDRGVAPCISTSLWLERAFRAAGYQAHARRGWVLGMLDLSHAWLEVRDDDGETKVVDPVFALISRHTERRHPEFPAACFGSAFNRLLPTDRSPDQPLVEHRCGGEPAPLRKRLAVRPLKGGAAT